MHPCGVEERSPIRCALRPVRSSLIAVSTLTILLTGCATEEEPGDTGGATESPGPGGTIGQVLEETSPDGHKLREVPADEAPSVTLSVTEDPDAGWNVHVSTEGFTFAPERVGGEARPGEGHAHLYLDGVKIARLYGSWYHVPASAVSTGDHTLTVQLNANDHTAWATGGEAVSATAEVTSTGDDSGASHDHQRDSEAGAPSGSPAPTEPDADVTLQIQVANRKVSPSPGRVDVAQADTVRIEVVSDEPDTIHVHGYDVEAEVTPSAPAVLEFTADQPGLFEVETHESGLLLTQLVVE